MKQALTLLCLWFALAATAQPLPTPTVPEQLTFADLTVRFDPDARRLIQQDVNALMSNRQYWNAKLDRALLYFPVIETVLLSNGIPADFKYLALQESSLTPDAVSSSQAVGFWQFKRETAQDYGLLVNEEVDERKNISASTAGAARYLRRSNGMYTNWLSALYSFYLGTGGISKIVSPEWANSHDITLDGRTDRYMLRFFAHKLAVEYAVRTYQPVNTFSLVEYTGGAGKTINEIANELSLNANDIRTYNRWLLIDHVPTDRPYVLAIPTPNGQINELRQRMAQASGKPLNTVVASSGDDIGFPVLKRVTLTAATANEPILYEINGLPGVQAQSGDNAGMLARKAKISLSSFLRFNDMGERDAITPGEVYYLAKKRKKSLVPFHTARPDESMRGISQRYAIRLKKLLRYNRMDRVQKLQVGRVLWLRERRPSKTPIEIITDPIPPVYDNSPGTPSTRPVAERSRVDAPGSGQTANAIPKNASERKRYQPKLLGNATPSTLPEERAAEVKSAPSRAAVIPSGRPAAAEPTPSVTTAVTPDRANPGETVEVPVAPRDAGSPQRTIIVRSEGESVRERTTPARQVPGTLQETPDPQNLPVDVTVSSQTSRPAPTTTSPAKQVPTQQPVERTPLPRNQSVTIPPLPPMTTEAPPAETSRGRTMKHTVEAGHTYYSLSRYYGISVDDLLRSNSLTLDDKLAVGQVLTVQHVPTGYPSGQPTSPPAAVPTDATPQAAPRSGSPLPPVTVTPPTTEPTYHVVAKGETLYRISKTYNVTIEQLLQWNDLADLGVKEGQKLKVSQ